MRAKGSEPARDTTGLAGFAASGRSIDEDDDPSIVMAMAVVVVHVVIVVVVCKPVNGSRTKCISKSLSNFT
jgi:hypothetical protein